MVAERNPLLTREEYLAFERASDTRHEYVAGEVVAMTGASRRHSLIQSATLTSLNLQLWGRPCEVHGSDLRVKIAALGIYTYPDITVVCGEPILEDNERDTLLNPLVLIEILSPSTERYDRRLKFQRYRHIPSFREYLLIAQDRPRVERYTRLEDDTWPLVVHEGLNAAVTLDTLGCTLALGDIYHRVAFA